LAKLVTRPDGTTDHRWTGKVELVESALDQPLRWRRPRRIFVNSTSDLFHESVPDDWIDRVFAVMALAPHHTFQVLTKRPERARNYMNGRAAWVRVLALLDTTKPSDLWNGGLFQARYHLETGRPLPNVWLGTSIEDQATADARIPHLLATPAAVRFVSAEPLLGPVDLTKPGWWRPIIDDEYGAGHEWLTAINIPSPRSRTASQIHWVIVGGESGPGARPMHPDWARSLRDQCTAAGVAFFFKQWGEFVWRLRHEPPQASEYPHKVGKGAAGRLLDGGTWDQMPGDQP
jgi:protein gp37